MEFSYSAQQQELMDSTREFAQGALNKNAANRIKAHEFDRTMWAQAAEFGFTGLPIPEKWGGLGLPAQDCMMMLEAMGEGCEDLGLSFSLSAHMFACAVPIWRFGDEKIHEKFLRPIASGDWIAANAATEPGAGSDVYAMKTKATKTEGGYLLNGQKCFISNAPVADVFLVYAKTAENQGFFGISAFVIHKDTKGLSLGPNHPKNSLPTSTWTDVYFDDVFVPEEQRVGDEGVGGIMFHDSMVWEKGCLFASYVGAMKRVLDRSLEHVKERRQFGKAIAEFQSVSNRIVDMKMRLETARLMLYRAGWLYDQGKDCEAEISMSKILISESAVQSGLDAIQIFGGSGIAEEMGIDRLLLDSIPSRIFSGTNDVQREIIARKLGIKR